MATNKFIIENKIINDKSILLTSNSLKISNLNRIWFIIFLSPIIVKGIITGNSKNAYLGEPAPM